MSGWFTPSLIWSATLHVIAQPADVSMLSVGVAMVALSNVAPPAKAGFQVFPPSGERKSRVCSKTLLPLWRCG